MKRKKMKRKISEGKRKQGVTEKERFKWECNQRRNKKDKKRRENLMNENKEGKEK